jgi:hypothetical protein
MIMIHKIKNQEQSMMLTYFYQTPGMNNNDVDFNITLSYHVFYI